MHIKQTHGLPLLLMTLLPFSATAQQAQDPLSEGQADQIRELGTRPVDRIKLYLKYVNDRVAAIKELTPDATENNRPGELRARYEEFTRLCDELSENIDTYDGDHADIRKALRSVSDASAKWAAVLQAPPPDRTYDFSRKLALDAAQSVVDQATKLLAAENTYFAAHKDQSGGNGKAPSPER